MITKSGFSLYDIEQFLRDAGAEKVNERAVRSFQVELEHTVKELVEEAALYANYAGRRKIIKRSDVELARGGGPHNYLKMPNRRRNGKPVRRRISPIVSSYGNRILIKAGVPKPSENKPVL